jgi:hypothetical protein
MCLTILANEDKEIVPKVATEDIIAYKYFRKRSFFSNVLLTPYRDKKYLFEKGKQIASNLDKKARYIVRKRDKDGKIKHIYFIEVGFHSFKERNMIKYPIIKDELKSCVQIRITIPKGALYYEGFFIKEEVLSYASNTYIFQEIIRESLIEKFIKKLKYVFSN